MLRIKQIGTICFAIFAFISPLFATGVSSTASTADCDNATLNTYTGTSNLQANWDANEIDLHWYADSDATIEMEVASASQGCTYDGTLTPPATIPTKTGYTFKGWKVKEIPYGYTRLEYIQSSGTQYINTNYVLQETDRVEVDYELTNLSATGDKFIIGQKASDSTGNMWVETYGNTNKWYVRWGSSSSVNTTFNSSQTSGTFIIKKNSFIVNGTEILQPNYTSMNLNPLVIFGRIGTNDVFKGSYVRISEVRIKDSDEHIQRKYIPTKRNSDNVFGMWDTVSKTFLTNAGTGTFTAGPAVQ